MASERQLGLRPRLDLGERRRAASSRPPGRPRGTGRATAVLSRSRACSRSSGELPSPSSRRQRSPKASTSSTVAPYFRLEALDVASRDSISSRRPGVEVERLAVVAQEQGKIADLSQDGAAGLDVGREARIDASPAPRRGGRLTPRRDSNCGLVLVERAVGLVRKRGQTARVGLDDASPGAELLLLRRRARPSRSPRPGTRASRGAARRRARRCGGPPARPRSPAASDRAPRARSPRRRAPRTRRAGRDASRDRAGPAARAARGWSRGAARAPGRGRRGQRAVDGGLPLAGSWRSPGAARSPALPGDRAPRARRPTSGLSTRPSTTALPDPLRIRSAEARAPEKQAQGVNQDRLPRPGFARQEGEPGAKLQLSRGDKCDVT